MRSLDDSVRTSLQEMLAEVQTSLETVKTDTSKDLEIDPIDLDSEALGVPKLHSKYLNLFSDETVRLKNLYAFHAKVKLERWKYWMGKQTDEYYARNGIVHEKILKTDVDAYLAADEKLEIVNAIVATQKAIVDLLERVLKEISSRNFHIKAAIDWRKFTSGA